MITLGLTTWSEHQSLLGQVKPLELSQYAAFFPVVEVDTFFYALPAKETIQAWQAQVPTSFQFITKVPKIITGHQREVSSQAIKKSIVAYQEVLAPLKATKQVKAVLLQFPPYFHPQAKSWHYLRYLRQALGDLPLALELRHQSWYHGEMATRLVDFCRQQGFILVSAQESQTSGNSVPFNLEVTSSDLAILRLHGLNKAGWQNQGPDWRNQRTLYRYSPAEIKSLAQQVQNLTSKVREVCVIFNNNSGGDAADNALMLQKELGVEFANLAPMPPRQLDLF
ncbi:DUF72 domain-containing protein [Ligilactobacillus equi]|uniref:DUF72 domain-containing protein n=2 Tax=Ligilactobacillus equi TaxID=137357 RepID=V7HV35_9LACO|nr:DUF72 domain-containing protein [Ligilactobacillus equi]ETA74089.1 hypothetical protein LEQ_0556 [Ligilactobacillus equi DPC 6820]KRL82037.1 hypothetical protein FC36_GL001262 [Ligilactobacillus equi DSM 15833 = JCM 10991]MCQ2557083.1 DUF72 domain-containing protein [Ligilactobacillus sp.]